MEKQALATHRLCNARDAFRISAYKPENNNLVFFFSYAIRLVVRHIKGVDSCWARVPPGTWVVASRQLSKRRGQETKLRGLQDRRVAIGDSASRQDVILRESVVETFRLRG